MLPFENEGTAADDYFADGMTDEVRSRLSAVPGLQVTARTSTRPIQEDDQGPARHRARASVDICSRARFAGARATDRIAYASRRSSCRSRTIRQVVGAVRHGDVGRVRGAGAIASHVAADARTSRSRAPTQQRLAARPTANLEAYDEFLKGEQITANVGTGDSKVLNAGSRTTSGRSRSTRISSRRGRVARALAYINNAGPTMEPSNETRVGGRAGDVLGPIAPKGHLAMGAYLRDVEARLRGARAHYDAGLKLDPNNTDLLIGDAGVGRHPRASSTTRSPAHSRRQSSTRGRSRRCGASRRCCTICVAIPEELAAWDRALALAPDNLGLIQGKAFAYLSLGELDSVHALVAQKLKTVDTTALLVRFSLYQETMWTLPPELWPKIVKLTPKDFDNDRGHWGLKLGHTYRLMGDTMHARMFGDTAVVAFAKQLHDFPDRAQLRELLARALALAGRKQEAAIQADSALKLRETTNDATLKPYVLFQAARVFIQSGENERALDLIERLITMPASDVTAAYLRIDPSFAPLKGNPRFEKLIAGKPTIAH